MEWQGSTGHQDDPRKAHRLDDGKAKAKAKAKRGATSNIEARLLALERPSHGHHRYGLHSLLDDELFMRRGVVGRILEAHGGDGRTGRAGGELGQREENLSDLPLWMRHARRDLN